MKTITRRIAIFVIIMAMPFIFMSCVERYVTIHVYSYIHCYYLSSDIIDLRCEETDSSVYVNLRLCSYSDIEPRKVTIVSEGEDKEIFDSLSAKYGDADYENTISRFWDDEDSWFFKKYAFDYTPTSISIVSDSDFNEEYKAGEELNDLISMTFNDYHHFIESGYTTFERKTIPLRDLTPDDMVLLFVTNAPFWTSTVLIFTFDTYPTLSQEHTFTFTFDSETDGTFSKTVTVDFSSVEFSF